MPRNGRRDRCAVALSLMLILLGAAAGAAMLPVAAAPMVLLAAGALPLALLSFLLAAARAALRRRGAGRSSAAAHFLPSLLFAALPIADRLDALPGAGQGGPALRIVSANMYRANREPLAAIAAVMRQDADVVVMQETAGTVRSALPRLGRLYPYRTPCVGPCGLVIWSKRPIVLENERFPLRLPWQFRRRLMVATTSDRVGRPFHIATIHYPQPLPVDKQAEVRAAVAEALARTDTADLILAGDMNTNAWGYVIEEQDAMFAPMDRLTHGLLTYPALLDFGGAAIRLPIVAIDHLYAGREWRGAAAKAFTIPGSDHRGISADLARGRR